MAEILVATTDIEVPSAFTGNLDIVDPTIGFTPKAAIFFMSYVSSPGTLLPHMQIGYGAADAAGNQWCVPARSQGSTGRSNTSAAFKSDICVGYPPNSGGTLQCRAATVGPIANGWRVNVLSAPSGIRYGKAIFFGGADLQADVGHQALAEDTSPQPVTMAFQPNLAFMGWCGRAADTGPSIVDNTAARPSFGWAHDTGVGTAQRAVATNSVANSTNPTTFHAWLENAILGNVNNSAVLKSIAVTGWNVDGFTLQSSEDIGGGAGVGWLALDTADRPVWIGTLTTPLVDNAPWVVTDPGFRPIWAEVIASNQRVADIGSANQELSFAINVCDYDGREQNVMAWSDDDGQSGTTRTATHLDRSRWLDVYARNTTAQYQMAVSDPASGFTDLGWDIAAADIDAVLDTARTFFGVAIGADTGVAEPEADLSGTILDATTEQDIRDGGRIIQVDITGATLVP